LTTAITDLVVFLPLALGAALGGFLGWRRQARYRVSLLCHGAVLGLAVHLSLAQVVRFSWYIHHGLPVTVLTLLSGLLLVHVPRWWSGEHPRARAARPAPDPVPSGIPRDEAVELASLLHDTVGQGLTAISMKARDAEQRDGRLQMIEQAAAHTMIELRAILTQLRTGSRLPHLPPECLIDVVNRFRGSGLAIEFTASGTDEQLPASLRAVVVRIAREALTNSMKYAPDATVFVEFDVRAKVSLRVWSHGSCQSRRRDPERIVHRASTAWSGGHGTRMMQRLVARHHGTLRIGSHRRGYSILATFPLQGGEAAAAAVTGNRVKFDHLAD
jgi:Histidine kinase